MYRGSRVQVCRTTRLERRHRVDDDLEEDVQGHDAGAARTRHWLGAEQRLEERVAIHVAQVEHVGGLAIHRL